MEHADVPEADLHRRARDLLEDARRCAADAHDVHDSLSRLQTEMASKLRDGNAEIARARGHVASGVEAQQQALSFASMGRVAGSIAHDLNNLLTVILSYGGAALDKAEGEALHHDLVQMLRAAQHAAVLTRQILRHGRPSPSPSEWTILNLDEVVEGVKPMIVRLLGGSVVLETALAGGGSYVRAHPGELEQLLFNLVVNARDAMRGTGTMRIETAAVDRTPAVTDGDGSSALVPCVMLAVDDTGTGMDEETLARVFEPFFTTKGAERGTGLGMTTVSRIARDGGAQFELESGVGRGSSVRLYFPRVDSPRAGAPDVVLGAVRTEAHETILLVEDDAVVREAMAACLETLGYRVVATSSPARAIAICEQVDEPVDLLLTDVDMPAMSGRQLAAIATNIRPGVAVLFASGLGQTALADHGAHDPEMLFLEKPFTMAALADAVRQALSR